MWMLTLACVAWAVAPGATEVVVAHGNTVWGSNSTSITGADGELWFAEESFDTVNHPTNSLLATYHFDFGVGSGYDDAQALEGFGFLVANTFDLTGDLILPTVLAWDGGTRLVTVGKEDVLQTEGHLHVYTEDRSNLSNIIGDEAVTATNTGHEHTKPDLVRDAGLPEQYLCWTRKTTTPGSDDAWSKPKDASTWLASTDRAILSTADVEDHCMEAVNSEGVLYTVFHRDYSTANGQSGDDIWLRVSTWDGTTWTTNDMHELAGSDGANFPTIFSRYTGIGTASKVVIAARDVNQDFVYWSCGGTAANCHGTDFGSSVTPFITGGDHREPKVIAVPRGGGTLTPDVFVAFEYDSGTTHTIHIASNCADNGTWNDEGPLPVPAGYSTNNLRFGIVSSFSSARTVYVDGSEFDIAFLARNPSTGSTSNIMRYHATAGDFCP